MKYPTLNAPETSRDMLQTFLGYNSAVRINDGEWNDCNNISNDNYPVLSAQNLRYKCGNLNNRQDIFSYDNKLIYILKDSGAVKFGGNTVSVTLKTTLYPLSTYPRQYVRMGSYVLIFPDNVYFNANDSTDCGDIEKSYSGTGFNLRKCNKDGATFPTVTFSATEPSTPTDGQLWCDTTSEPFIYKKWYENLQTWLLYEENYIRIGSSGIGANFNVGDGVFISGLKGTEQDSSSLNFKTTQEQIDAMEGNHIVVSKSDNYIVIEGKMYGLASFTGKPISITRKIPDMDFVVECQNRLWGCKYGEVDSQIINEIYCCKLGDFKNWYSYKGISTDSWTASCGTDGEWTGASVLNGKPVFFKENYIHTVYISSTGAHQVSAEELYGVQKGSHKSICVNEGYIYYLSKEGVMVYSGSSPVCISEPIGNFGMYNGSSCFSRGKYYLTVDDNYNASLATRNTFIYDTNRKTWQKTSGHDAYTYTVIDQFPIWVGKNGIIWFEEPFEGKRNSIVGLPTPFLEAEDNKMWHMETGKIGLSYPDNKYVTRFCIRIELDEPLPDRYIEMFMRYNTEENWKSMGSITRPGIHSVTLPVRPTRCDTCQIRFEGKGKFNLYSISKVLEQGGESY